MCVKKDRINIKWLVIVNSIPNNEVHSLVVPFNLNSKKSIKIIWYYRIELIYLCTIYFR